MRLSALLCALLILLCACGNSRRGNGDDDDAANDDDSAVVDDDDDSADDDDDDDATGAVATCTGANSLFDGDFEAGGVGWAQTSSLGATNITQFGAATPYSGTWLAELGQYSSEVSTISQDVVIPSSVTWVDLFFRYRIDTNESSIIPYDTGELVIIDPASGVPLLTAESWDNGDDTSGFWLQRIIDLRDDRGSTIRLQWQWSNDGSSTTSLFVDLVNLTCS